MPNGIYDELVLSGPSTPGSPKSSRTQSSGWRPCTFDESTPASPKSSHTQSSWKPCTFDDSFGSKKADFHTNIPRSIREKSDPCRFEVIDLCNRDLNSNDAKLLAEVLSRSEMSSIVRELYLSFNKIGAEGASAIGDSIARLANLRKLVLDFNGIQAAGAAAIGASVAGTRRLRTLGLRGNEIGEEGALAVARGVAKLGALETLDLGENPIGESGTKAVCEAVSGMASLHVLKLGSVTLDAQREIKASIRQSSCVVLFDGAGDEQHTVQECKCFMLFEMVIWVPVCIWACVKGQCC